MISNDLRAVRDMAATQSTFLPRAEMHSSVNPNDHMFDLFMVNATDSSPVVANKYQEAVSP